MTHAFICDAVRTPIGRLNGSLSTIRADDLAALPIRALIERNPGVDWAALDDDALLAQPDPVNLLFSRGTARHIAELIVGGRSVVKDHCVTGIDLPAARQEVLAQMRTGMAANGHLATALDALGQCVAQHHLADPPCC